MLVAILAMSLSATLSNAATPQSSSSPARPADGNIARLGELEDARERIVPTNVQPAAYEGDERTGTRMPFRRVRRSSRRPDDARVDRTFGAERFRVYARP